MASGGAKVVHTSSIVVCEDYRHLHDVGGGGRRGRGRGRGGGHRRRGGRRAAARGQQLEGGATR